MKGKISVIVLTATILMACNPQSKKITPEEAKQIAKEAYIYGLPMVMNFKTLDAYTLDKNSKEYKGEFNQKSCEARVYTPEDKAIVTPNSDTPYCIFWSDIRDEPVVISVPEMEPGRFYHFQLIDLFSHNFAYIGTLTNDNKAGVYMIAPIDWKGDLPEGIADIIYCETGLFLTIVRTQLMNADDLNNVKSIQDRYHLETLSAFLGKEAIASSKEDVFPEWTEGDQFTEEAFKYVDAILDLTYPIEEEKALRQQFAKLNIGTKKAFDINDFDKAVQEAIKEGVKEGFAEIEKFVTKESSDPLSSTKIFGTREFLNESAKAHYGLDKMFLPRAVAAYMGLYGNSGSEASYPLYMTDAEGNPLNASENEYTLKLEAGNFPPVKAFWSLTMYDGITQLLIDNPLDRYLVNSPMMDDFVMNEDGSLTFYIQKDSPGEDLEANWLPAPDGPFYCVMRLYGPEEAALNGAWTSPPIQVKN
jgi:hypothetical protein